MTNQLPSFPPQPQGGFENRSGDGSSPMFAAQPWKRRDKQSPPPAFALLESALPLVRRLLPVLALVVFPTTSLLAVEVFVTSMIWPESGEISACPPSCATGSVSSSGSSSVSTAAPTPTIPAALRKAQFGYTNDCAWSVTPGNITQTSSSGTWTFQGLLCQDWYKVFITKGTSTSCSADLLVNLTVDASTSLITWTATPCRPSY